MLLRAESSVKSLRKASQGKDVLSLLGMWVSEGEIVAESTCLRVVPSVVRGQKGSQLPMA